MLLLGVLSLSLVIGLLRGGRLDALAQHRWRLPALPLLAVGIQVIAFLPDESASPLTRTFTAVLHVSSYVLALGFIWFNRRMPWLWLIGLGLTANTIAIAANGGFMPVSPAALETIPGAGVSLKGVYNNAELMGDDTRLGFLGDVLQTPNWFLLRRAFSIGDVTIAVGAFALLQHLMRRRTRVSPGGAA